jgi:hypothetical protein
MNKFLVISIITLIFVGTSPVSAWSPFEHSTKDWDWKDWTFFGCVLGAGILAIAGIVYGGYKAYQHYKLSKIPVETMAERFVRRNPKWTTDPMDIEQFNPLPVSDHTLNEVMGVHTIEFEDESKASIFHDILKELKKIDATLQTIYNERNLLIRGNIVISGSPLASIETFLGNTPAFTTDDCPTYIPQHTDVVSTLHQFLPFEGMDEVLPGFVRETFVFRNSIHLTPQQLFGQTLADHMLERSYFVNYNVYGDFGASPVFTNQHGDYKYFSFAA